ncbi:DNA damage-inducible protein D [Haematospirillum sp. 15-248]|nr:DNA damage-inducible protein D [Haematospirillum sp. 15-248]
MNDGEIEKLIAAFEAAARKDGGGKEFWFARDLQKLLGYDRWENFLSSISRAKIACENSGQRVDDHFRDVTKMVELGSGAVREIEDMKLGRYACYLITQNSDARKKPVAFGQSYFAIQTRRLEVADEGAVPTHEDQKRVFIRDQIKRHNRYLSSAAREAGVVTSQEFANFHSSGYQGLYGKTLPEIRRYKGLARNANVLDRMGSTELAANFFRVTQTEEKLRKDGVKGAKNANATHYAVGRQVRDAMLKISGIAPENLPVADSIRQVEKRLKLEAQNTPPAIDWSEAQSDVSEQDRNAIPSKSDQKEERLPVNLRTDLWKFALLVMATKPHGAISTSELIAELPNYIRVPDDSQEVLTGRKDTKFSQIVRNLKSHKAAKNNLIYQGYAEDVDGGFKITPKGHDFVKTYFSE